MKHLLYVLLGLLVRAAVIGVLTSLQMGTTISMLIGLVLFSGESYLIGKGILGAKWNGQR